MTWPTTSPSSHSAAHPGYPIDPHQYTIGPTHLSGTTTTSVDHLFGQPSTLHPSWASTTSLPSTTHSTPSPSFTSLATSSDPLPAQHLVPSTPPTTSSDSTTYHSVAAPTGPAFSTAWPTAPAPVHEPSVPPTPLPCSPHPLRVHQPQPVATTTSTPPSTTPRQTAVKAAPKVRSEKKAEKPRRSTPTAPSTTTIDAPSAPSASPSVQQDLATLGSTTHQLAESVRIIQAQQQMILDSQRLHEQRQQQLRQDLPPTAPTPPTPIIVHIDTTNPGTSPCTESQTH